MQKFIELIHKLFLLFRNSTSSIKDDVPIKDETDSKVSRHFRFHIWAVLTILSKFKVVNYRAAMGM
jgi:hypothetical protein